MKSMGNVEERNRQLISSAEINWIAPAVVGPDAHDLTGRRPRFHIAHDGEIYAYRWGVWRGLDNGQTFGFFAIIPDKQQDKKYHIHDLFGHSWEITEPEVMRFLYHASTSAPGLSHQYERVLIGYDFLMYLYPDGRAGDFKAKIYVLSHESEEIIQISQERTLGSTRIGWAINDTEATRKMGRLP